MNLKKLAAALSMIGMVAFGGTANAAATITNLDGTNGIFGGFDWAQGSAAWTAGFLPSVGDTFTLYYAGWASNVTMSDGNNFPGSVLPQFDGSADGLKNSPASGFGGGSYEYTVFAAITEEVVSCGVSSCAFKVTGGTFDIYYDTNANAKTANNAAWTGFTDGTKIIGGTFDPSTTDQLFNNATGGQADVYGAVTFTNALYINPALTGTKVTSTLQLGSAVTTFSKPTSVDGTGIGVGEVLFQADANQTFTSEVPEPGALALAGLALLGCGVASRRRKAA